ncbi:hypothetical protein GCM10027072_80390 [Streptomyces bullii]
MPAARAAGHTERGVFLNEHIRHTVDLLPDRSRLLADRSAFRVRRSALCSMHAVGSAWPEFPPIEGIGGSAVRSVRVQSHGGEGWAFRLALTEAAGGTAGRCAR